MQSTAAALIVAIVAVLVALVKLTAASTRAACHPVMAVTAFALQSVLNRRTMPTG